METRSVVTRAGRLWGSAAILIATAGVLLGGPAAASAFDPVYEAKNFSKTQERTAIFSTPSYQAQLRQTGPQERLGGLGLLASDPERDFATTLCWSHEDGCAGDIRLYDWGTNGYGLVEPVLFTARNGATLSGHVWATTAGPAKRPAIEITNGSVQADEQMYWFVAQTLAKQGYVVLTFDPQGQGRSDVHGEAPTRTRAFRPRPTAVPSSTAPRTRSTSCSPTPSVPTSRSRAAPPAPATPPSRAGEWPPDWTPPTTRSGAGRSQRIGIAGHSYGAAGVSYIGQWDPRVDAVVAWDNLGRTDPSAPFMGGGPVEQPCPATRRRASRADHQAGARHVCRLRPAGDAQHARTPTRGEDRQFGRLREAGVDSGELIIRGGAAPTSAGSPTQPSAEACAARTRSAGTRPRGSTSTSRAIRAPTPGC